MDWQQSGNGRRERRCRASISGPMRPHAPSAFQGAPCLLGSPPASSAFAVLVARYFSPLRTFKQRLTATASRLSASQNRAVSQSRPARSPRMCRPLAESRRHANTGCSASHRSQPHCSQPPTASALVPTPARSPEPLHCPALLYSWRCSHDHAAEVPAPQPKHGAQWIFQRIPLGNNWQSYRLLVPISATRCKAGEVNLTQAGV